MFRPNPEFRVGDWVRNHEQILRGDRIVLDRHSTGIIEKAGKYMGKTAYDVKFYLSEGESKMFRFFADEIEPAFPTSFRQNPEEVSELAKQPHSRNLGGDGTRQPRIGKKRIPIQRFESWLKNHGAPNEWDRYQKEKVAYKRFHHGAEPRFVTRALVDVGMGTKKVVGRAFGYSMGKSPFEPYITPTGSKKGSGQPFLHEYETLPEGVTNSSGKVVIKPLEGRTKITDWIYH